MDELNEALNSLLRDPKQMAAIQQLAGELFGGQTAGAAGGSGPGGAAGLDGTSGSGGQAASGAQQPRGAGLGALLSGAQPSGKAALVKALSPYLRPERGAKLQKALRLAQAIRLAGAAWERLGGEGGV